MARQKLREPIVVSLGTRRPATDLARSTRQASEEQLPGKLQPTVEQVPSTCHTERARRRTRNGPKPPGNGAGPHPGNGGEGAWAGGLAVQTKTFDPCPILKQAQLGQAISYPLPIQLVLCFCSARCGHLAQGPR